MQGLSEQGMAKVSIQEKKLTNNSLNSVIC